MQGFNKNNSKQPGMSPALLNFRPPYAEPTPLQLMHPFFGTFMDIYYGRSTDPSTRPSRREYGFLQELCQTMCNVYSTEEDRQVKRATKTC